MPRIDDPMIAHLREIAATRAERGGAPDPSEGPPTEAALPAMTRIAGRFTIERRLGQGGMGAVYLAYDHEVGDRVALKIVHAGDPSLDARFEREARTLESLTHPGIVRHVTHGVTTDGTWFLATEVLSGRTLRELLRHGPFDVGATAWLGAQIGAVLSYLHASNLVHRDLTPNNVFCCDDGSIRLIDFGLTGVVGGAHTLTGQGGVVGTMGFMSPEQARGEAIDARSDLFSLGCVLVACLTGRPPFGSALAELLVNLDRDSDPTRQCPADLPPPMREVLRGLLARNPASRPASGLEVTRSLSAYAGAFPPGAAPRVTVVARSGDVPAVAFRWASPSGPMLTVVAKLTFDLRPGRATLAAFQDDVALSDRHVAGDPGRPLLAPSDAAPFKPASDLLVVGHAYAPGGVAVPRLTARVRVGGIEKSIDVFGARTVPHDGVPGAPRPAARFPLSWERAARGARGENPVGVDPSPGARTTFAPSVAPAGTGLDVPASSVRTAGLGPIAARWPPRVDALGAGDPRWLDGVPTDRPFGAPSSPLFFNAAPPDQRPPQPFREDERVELDNLDPRQAVLSTCLPGLRPRVTLRTPTQGVPVMLRADTLLIDTDRGTATMTWRGQTPLVDGGCALEASIEAAGAPDGGSEDAHAADALMAFTLSSPNQPASPALPFAGAGALKTVSEVDSSDSTTPGDVRLGQNVTRSRTSFAVVERLWSVAGSSIDPSRLLTADAWSLEELESMVHDALTRGAAAPVVTLAGELTLAWDDVERLIVWSAFGSNLPGARNDPDLAELLDRAALALGGRFTPRSVAREIADGIEAASVIAGAARPAVERALLERRAYDRRTLLGGERLRGFLAVSGAPPLPCYLPADAGAHLPLAASLAARVHAEVRPRQDAEESHRLCLAPLALGRAVGPAA